MIRGIEHNRTPEIYCPHKGATASAGWTSMADSNDENDSSMLMEDLQKRTCTPRSPQRLVRVAAAFGLGLLIVVSSPLASDEGGTATGQSVPITVNGADFVMATDAVWTVPTTSAAAPSIVRLRLLIENRTTTELRFNRFDTLRIAVTAPDGGALPFDGGRNATLPGEFVSAPVAPGRSLVLVRDARLFRVAAQASRLVGSDDFGGIWYVDLPAPGQYSVSMSYANERPTIGNAASIWVGRMVTPGVQVTVR